MYLTLRVTGNIIWPILLHASTDPSIFLFGLYPDRPIHPAGRLRQRRRDPHRPGTAHLRPRSRHAKERSGTRAAGHRLTTIARPSHLRSSTSIHNPGGVGGAPGGMEVSTLADWKQETNSSYPARPVAPPPSPRMSNGGCTTRWMSSRDVADAEHRTRAPSFARPDHPVASMGDHTPTATPPRPDLDSGSRNDADVLMRNCHPCPETSHDESRRQLPDLGPMPTVGVSQTLVRVNAVRSMFQDPRKHADGSGRSVR